MSDQLAYTELHDRIQRRVFLLVGSLVGIALPATILCTVISNRPTHELAQHKPAQDRVNWRTGHVDARKPAKAPFRLQARPLLVIRPEVARRRSRVAPAGAQRLVPDTPPRPPAVALRPGEIRWRHLAEPKLITITDEVLIASLEQTAVEIDLYDPKFGKTNSFVAIARSMQQATQGKFRPDVVQRREHALADLKCDERYRKAAEQYEKTLKETQNLYTSDLARHEVAVSQLLRKVDSPEDTPNDRNAAHKLSLRVPTVERWMLERPDLRGLPFLLGTACESDFKAANTLRIHSRQFRALLSRRRVSSSLSSSRISERDDISGRELNPQVIGAVVSKSWKKDDVPALKQILQAGEADQRSSLVLALSKINDPSASVALAERALFDTSRDVRNEAISALRGRPADEYRGTLLKGLEHPWLPAMAHAAEALVVLNDRGSIKHLKRLLSRPDPTAPYQTSDGKWAVRELVRVNHMRNCYLCHAPSVSKHDTIRGVVPSPGSSLPRVYYSSSRGPFVRADIVYLRQDFSVTHAVENHKPWPKMQRFDYLVRTRSITEKQAQEIVRERKSQGKLSAYRLAVLYALHNLERSRASRAGL